jgi:dihydroorotase/N-acyl-D-amino-acid deacylase
MSTRHRRSRSRVLALLAAICALAPATQLRAQATYDLLIRNGTVLDGTGAAGVRADVAVRAGRVVRVSRRPIPVREASRVIDASRLVVAPGFIDLHAHIEPIGALPDAASHVRQGVTLAVGGPDGGGLSPFGASIDSISRLPLGMNVAYLAGHNVIRSSVMGRDNRPPTAAELARMEQAVADAMDAGAFGLSTGLLYVPGNYASIDEVVALARVAAERGGFYTSHLRSEGKGLLDGVTEAIDIGRRASIPVVLTHHKALGPAQWGLSRRTLAMVDSARAAGRDVMVDAYPYTATSTGLAVLIPQWALAGGREQLAARANNPVVRDSILRGIVEELANDRGGGDLRRVQFAAVSWNRALEGKTLADYAAQRGLPTTPAAVAPLVLEGELAGGASMIYHVMDEADVRRILAHPWTAVASDGGLTAPGRGVPHPRSYGTFPRVLGEYVRRQHVLTLPEAVRKMTSLPAARLGLADRGCLRDGCVADITIFDPATVDERGTFSDPHQYPVGIPWVIVNGVPVVEQGQLGAARPGVVVRHRRPAAR